MKRDDLNLWINFALRAIYGQMREADALMRTFGVAVRRAADEMCRRYPVRSVPLYRGILLDPARGYASDDRYTFVSWSEDVDVARWFACPRSAVSVYAASVVPGLRGFLVELPRPTSRVLYHHSWARRFDGLAPLALSRPQMGVEGARQVAWSTTTQREVITEPTPMTPTPAPELNAEQLEALERKLSPPWILATEGARR